MKMSRELDLGRLDFSKFCKPLQWSNSIIGFKKPTAQVETGRQTGFESRRIDRRVGMVLLEEKMTGEIIWSISKTNQKGSN